MCVCVCKGVGEEGVGRWEFGETAFKKSVFVGEIRIFQKGVVYIVVRFAWMVERDR